MSCSDKGVNYLAGLGYSVVRIPRANVAPNDMIGKAKDTLRLGKLSQLIVASSSPEPPITAGAASNISGQRTSKMKVGIGLNVLEPIIGALAGATLGATLGYEKAQKLQFQFDDVMQDAVDPALVGRYLRAAEVDVQNPVLKKYLLGKNAQLLLIMETLKSSKLTVQSEGSSSTNFGLDVPVIQATVSGKLNVDVSKANQGQVSYTGQNPLVFGFKAMRVAIIDGQLDVTDIAPSDISLAMGGFAATDTVELLDFDEGNLEDA
jgi:hypothetical protein